MPVASIVIRANPVTNWEDFTLSLAREEVSQPRIERRDVGGHWSCKFDIAPERINRAFAADFLTNGVMRHVEIFNEKGIKDFEGFISQVLMNTGTAKIQNDVKDMANRVWVRYNTGGSVARSTKQNNIDSQARFGIKERVMVGGDLNSGVADQHAQQVLDWIGWPSPALREINLGGRVLDRPKLSIACLGYWHTLSFRTYNQTVVTTDADADFVIGDIVDSVGEFVRAKKIDSNGTQITREVNSDRNADDLIRSITALGDGSFHRWVAGMTDDRVFYYKQAKRPERLGA